jgi:hypothetical protein
MIRDRKAIPDTAAFSIDFACWLSQLAERDRGIISAFILSEHGCAEGGVNAKTFLPLRCSNGRDTHAPRIASTAGRSRAALPSSGRAPAVLRVPVLGELRRE